jgi:hypothetical protein
MSAVQGARTQRVFEEVTSGNICHLYCGLHVR